MFSCSTCHGTYGHLNWCETHSLAPWERELLRGPQGHREGEGDAIFTRTDGQTIKIENVRVDSVGPNASNPGVVSVEFLDTDKVVHLPFIQSWEITYRV